MSAATKAHSDSKSRKKKSVSSTTTSWSASQRTPLSLFGLNTTEWYKWCRTHVQFLPISFLCDIHHYKRVGTISSADHSRNSSASSVQRFASNALYDRNVLGIIHQFYTDSKGHTPPSASASSHNSPPRHATSMFDFFFFLAWVH
jgi:hypothetical protein